jgi:DNA-binding SARP family transcriptional activator
MEIRLFGPLEVQAGDGEVPLRRRQQRSLVAVLALRAGEVVSTDRLVEDLWGAAPPRSALGSLQNTVAAVRRALGAEAVVTQPPGYRLALPADAVDVHRFERLLATARGSDDAAERAPLLRQALELWRGPPLADLAFEPFAGAEIARLEELYVTAIEDRVEADLALGRHAEVVAELEGLVDAHPLRERLRGLLMVALYRCGRQAEALEVYRVARLALSDELGLDPSPELQELERKVLRQDPELAPPAFVAQAPPPAERRLVTVLAGVPPAEEEPEALRRALEELFQRAREALSRNGGELQRFGPEGFIAMFGDEAPSDDDAVRAVRVAVELGVPAGVATGEVVAGAGAVVTRAARLAREGGVRLDPRTHELVRDAVGVEPEGDAFRVLTLDPAAEGRARRLDAPLVGRERELTRLSASFLLAVTARRCRVVTVLGEPGIGKTRLARELAVRLGTRPQVLVARCAPQGRGGTFLPLLIALHAADAEHALGGESEAELVLNRLAALAEGAEATSLGESYWAVRRLLETLAAERPVLLVLDDLHWAEPALLDLVDYLADRAGAPILVLGLARPELERPLGETFTLGPLSPEEARAVVAGTATLSEEMNERIVELAEGNALYAEQLAVFAAEGGNGLPPSLEAVLAGRLGRLDPVERAVLQRASVVGREFTRDAVAALAEDEVVRHLLSLSRRGLVHPAPTAEPGDDGYTFHHVLLRDAAYASLTKADRADLHERVAAWIDRDGPGDDVIAGYHLEQAALLRRELGENADELAAAAGERLGEAGTQAYARGDLAAAAALLTRSTRLLPLGPRRAELLWEQSVALHHRARPRDARKALAAAERDAAASGAHSIAARVLAEKTSQELLYGRLSLPEAAAAYESALAILRKARDSRGLGQVELCASSLHWFACNFAETEAAAKRAARHYVAAGRPGASCISAQANALFYGPTPVEEAIPRCAALVDQWPDDLMVQASVTAVSGALQGLVGNVDEAWPLLDHAQTLFEDYGNETALRSMLTPLRIETAMATGEVAHATDLARVNVERLIADELWGAVPEALQLVVLLLDQGADAEATRYTDFVEERAHPSDVYVQFMRRAVRARLLARAGDVDAAVALADDGVAIASMTDALRHRARAHFAYAEVLRAAGRDVDAGAQEEAGNELLRRKGVKGARARTPSTLG